MAKNNHSEMKQASNTSQQAKANQKDSPEQPDQASTHVKSEEIRFKNADSLYE